MTQLLDYNKEALINLSAQEELNELVKLFKSENEAYLKLVDQTKDLRDEMKKLAEDELSTELDQLKSLKKEFTQLVSSAAEALEKDKKTLGSFFKARAKNVVEDSIEKGNVFEELKAELE